MGSYQPEYLILDTYPAYAPEKDFTRMVFASSHPINIGVRHFNFQMGCSVPLFHQCLGMP